MKFYKKRNSSRLFKIMEKENAAPIKLNPKKLVFLLLILSLSLGLVSLAAQFFRYLENDDDGLGLLPVMDVDHESSVPTIFSVQMLFLVVVVLSVISVFKHLSKDKFRWHWTLLTMGFLFMAFDEGSQIHELLTIPIRDLLGSGATGFFSFAWVIPGIILVLLVAFVFLKFIITLPRQTMIMCLVSGFIYLSGSIGLEMIGGNYAHAHSIHNLPYNMIVTIEEVLEMTGTALFIYTLLEYMKKDSAIFTIRFKS